MRCVRSSIQNQDLYDLQIVVVCRDAAPGVRHSLQVAADRDIHIDLIDVEDAKRGAWSSCRFCCLARLSNHRYERR